VTGGQADVLGKPFLTIAEVAAILGRSPDVARRWLRANDVELRLRGRKRLMVAVAELERVFPEIARALEIQRIAEASECPACGGPMQCARKCGYRRSA